MGTAEISVSEDPTTLRPRTYSGPVRGGFVPDLCSVTLATNGVG